MANLEKVLKCSDFAHVPLNRIYGLRQLLANLFKGFLVENSR